MPPWVWLLALLPWALFSLWLWLPHLLPPQLLPPWPWLVNAFPAKAPPDPAYLYLLSALSQGMAAVLALTFTVSLVAAQLTARYSYRLVERLLTPFTILYILFFALAVVLPLVLLPSPTPFQVKLSLSLGGLALALLVPYLRYYLYRITPRSLLEDLTREGEQKLRAGREAQEVEAIDNIAMSAFGFKDYDTFSLALKGLGNLAIAGTERVQKEATDDIWLRLREVALVTLEDPRAARLSILSLEVVGTAAAERGLEDAAGQAAFSLGEIGRVAVQKGLEDVAQRAALSLGQAGRAATERGLARAAWEAAEAVGEIGCAAAEKNYQDAARTAARGLWQVGMVAAEKGLEDAVDGAVSSLKNIGKVAIEKELIGLAQASLSHLGKVGRAATERTLKGSAQRSATALGEMGSAAAEKGLEGVARIAAASLRLINGIGGTGRQAVEGALGALRQDKGRKDALERFLREYLPELSPPSP